MATACWPQHAQVRTNNPARSVDQSLHLQLRARTAPQLPADAIHLDIRYFSDKPIVLKPVRQTLLLTHVLESR